MIRVQCITFKTPLIKKDDDLVAIILNTLEQNNVTLDDGDILAIASKVVSVVEGRIIDLSSIHVSDPRVHKIAEEADLEPEFVQLVFNEADQILGWVKGAILTIRNGVMQANAGIDHSNAGPNRCILLPKNPHHSAERLQKLIYEKTSKKIGILLVDSRTQPLRRGTIGLALATSGFSPLIDDRGRSDLFGYQMKITTRDVADDLASTAHLLMGECDEQTPLVLIKNAPIILNDEHYNLDQTLYMPMDMCLYMNNLTPKNLIDLKKEKDE